MWKKIRFLLSVGLVLFSLTLLVWSILPTISQMDEEFIPPSMMQMRLNGEVKVPAVLQVRLVRLKWPSRMRIGDNGLIILIFAPVEGDSSSPVYSKGFSNIYNNFNVMAEAKVEVAGLKVEPANPIRMSMPPGQPLIFKWMVRAENSGKYHGNVWLSPRFLPLDGSVSTQEPIYVQQIKIQATSLFGLKESMARLMGGVGVLLYLLFISRDMMDCISRMMKKTIIKASGKSVQKSPNDTKDL